MPPASTSRTAGLLLAFAAVLGAMISVQVGAAVAKQLFADLGAAGVATLRLAFAALILVALWRPWRRPPSRAAWRPILIYGAALGAMNLQFYLALARIPLGVAVALEFTGPLVVAVATSRRRSDLALVAMAAAGVLLLLPLHGAAEPLDWLGVAFALGAGACWGIYIIFGKRCGALAEGGVITSLGMCIGTLVALPVGGAEAAMALLQPALLPLIFAVASLSSAIPYSLEMVALKRLPSQTFSILMSAEPMLGALFGFLILDERLTAIQGCAIALIVAASVGASLSAARDAPPPVSAGA